MLYDFRMRLWSSEGWWFWGDGTCGQVNVRCCDECGLVCNKRNSGLSHKAGVASAARGAAECIDPRTPYLCSPPSLCDSTLGLLSAHTLRQLEVVTFSLHPTLPCIFISLGLDVLPAGFCLWKVFVNCAVFRSGSPHPERFRHVHYEPRDGHDHAWLVFLLKTPTKTTAVKYWWRNFFVVSSPTGCIKNNRLNAFIIEKSFSKLWRV